MVVWERKFKGRVIEYFGFQLLRGREKKWTQSLYFLIKVVTYTYISLHCMDFVSNWESENVWERYVEREKKIEKKKKEKYYCCYLIYGESTLYPPVVWLIYKLPTRNLKTDTLPTCGIFRLIPLPINVKNKN